jgi:hypothetical protein
MFSDTTTIQAPVKYLGGTDTVLVYRSYLLYCTVDYGLSKEL